MKQRSKIDQRLAELEREAHRLEKEIHAAEKRSRRPGKGPAPGIITRKPSAPEGAPGAGLSSGLREPSSPPPSRAKLNHYLATGSFRDPGMLRHERAVQRNKAIFMLIFVLILAYTIFKLLF
jgi:hypothetical protein